MSNSNSNQNHVGKVPQTFNPMLRTQLPDDVISVGYREVRPYHHAQVFRSQKVEFEGTEEEFVKAGLAYQYSELDQHRRLVHGGDQQPQPRKVHETSHPISAGKLTLYRVTLAWNPNDGDEGDYCSTTWALNHDDAIRAVAEEMADSGEQEFDTPADRDAFVQDIIDGAGPFSAEDYSALVDSGLAELLATSPDVLANIRDLIRGTVDAASESQAMQVIVATTEDLDGFHVTGANVEEEQLEFLLQNHSVLDVINQDGVELALWFDMDGQSLIAEAKNPGDYVKYPEDVTRKLNEHAGMIRFIEAIAANQFSDPVKRAGEFLVEIGHDISFGVTSHALIEKPFKPFTVIAFDESSGQSVCDHVLANNGIHSFWVAAQSRPDLTMVVAMPGRKTEGEGELVFPGEGVVDASTILEQPEVFGPAA